MGYYRVKSHQVQVRQMPLHPCYRCGPVTNFFCPPPLENFRPPLTKPPPPLDEKACIIWFHVLIISTNACTNEVKFRAVIRDFFYRPMYRYILFQLGVTGHKMLEREVAILKRVQHPHIVALEEVFETSEVSAHCSASNTCPTNLVPLSSNKYIIHSNA